MTYDFLEKILAAKRKEVAREEELTPLKRLEQSVHFSAKCVSLVQYLQRTDRQGVIAEIKRKSPSRGVLNASISIEQLSLSYMQAGASALSILTDQPFFGGSRGDLTEARKYNFCPILRKDFIIDEYQVFEAKAIGADVLLLIAACLKPNEVERFSALARSLGLEVLLEIHDEHDLTYLGDHIDLVGVNNRNLTTFEVDIETSFHLADKIPTSFTKISESGLSNPQTVLRLRAAGYKGFLMGERFMTHEDPGY